MNIQGLNKAEVLATLYNASKVQGMGFLQDDGKVMTTKDAEIILKERGGNTYFDYLKGKVMKIDVGQDELDTRLYNRDNGKDAAERALSKLFQDSPPRYKSQSIGDIGNYYAKQTKSLTQANQTNAPRTNTPNAPNERGLL